MTETAAPPAPPAEDELLDLRELVQTVRPTMTSAGLLQVRLQSALGPLDRVEASVAWQKLAQAEHAINTAPADADAKTRRQLAARYTDAEDRVLRIVVEGVTAEQLKALPPAERAGLAVAFYGATAEQVRRAVAVAAQAAHLGESQSPASSGSTAATPSDG
jgi:hypothetical protein